MTRLSECGATSKGMGVRRKTMGVQVRMRPRITGKQKIKPDE